MVTSESNRAPAPAPPYERQAPTFQPTSEAVAEPPRAEQPGPLAEQPMPLAVRDPLWFTSLVVAGATMGSMWGLSVLVLSILGLAGVLPMYILPVAGIVLGVAFLTLGAVGTAWARLFRFDEQENSRDRVMFSSGVATVLIAGIAAVGLGILNFAFLGDVRFTAATVIVLGLSLLLQSRVTRHVSEFAHDFAYRGAEVRRFSGPFAINALSMAPVRDSLVGLGSVILGVLAIMNIAPVVLGFVALLALGGAVALTASTICGATLATLKAACPKS
ncbi:MAG: hypothetical protein ACYC0Y_28970 [Pirellulales bacterium]